MKIRAMKSVLTLGAAALTLGLAACGGGGGNGSGGDDMSTLRRGISAKVDTLDPHKSSAQWENIIIGDMFIGLMTHGVDGRPVNGMADSYEISEDGLTWTFKLGDYSWSDGVPVTANDFVYALRRIQDPVIASQYSSLLYLIKNAKPLNEGSVAPEELGVRAIDDKTLEITLEYPAPYLPGLLTHYTTFPVPQHAVEKFGDAWIQPDNIVVNGPYQLKYWRTGDQLVTEKVEGNFGAAEACFDRVAYFELENANAVESRIGSGEMDINNGFDGARLKELEEKFPGWPRTNPALIMTYWSFNHQVEPFDDVRVRKALTMSVDRDFIIRNVLSPGYLPAYSMVPPGIDNYNADRPELEWKDLSRADRLVEARNLLEQAGFGPDNPLEFEFIHRSTDDNPKVAPVVQQNWNEIAPWVNSKPLKQDTKVLYARLRQNDFVVSDAAWAADFDDPINFLYLLESSTGQQNYGDYANSQYDGLLSAASNEQDLKKRAELFAEAEKIMLEDHAISPMWFQVTKNLVDPTLTGWEENAQDQHRSRFLCRAGMK